MSYPSPFGETALWRIRNPFNANDTLPIDRNEATQSQIDIRALLNHEKYHAWPFEPGVVDAFKRPSAHEQGSGVHFRIPDDTPSKR
jgi:hypothetical protein